MKNLTTRLAVLLLSTLSLLTGAFAQFTPSQDSYTFNNKGSQNYGTAPALQVESTLLSHAIANSYIQFDLSSIPSSYTGANVNKASLKLFVNFLSGAGGSFNLDLVNGSWTELGIKYNNAPALGTTIASSIPLTTANVNNYVIVDVTSAVQAWLDGTQSNDGIALVANSGLGVLFDSKENTATSHPPELDIVFASSGTITGITTTGSSGLIGGGTTGNLNLSLTNTCTANQILEWSGTSWMCAFPGTGTITGVTTNPGLTGGGVAGNVTIGIDPNVVAELGLENNFTASQSVNGSLSATYLFSSAGVTAGGGAVLPATGNSQTVGSPSNPLDLIASASNGSTATNQTFRWQNINTDGATPTANLNLLFGSGTGTPQPTGLSVASNGIISFAPNQTFPGGGGGGGVTTVVAGTGLSGGGSTPTVTLNVNQGLVAFQSDLTNGINTAETFATTAANTAQSAAETYANSTFVPLSAEGAFATLGANAFTGNQTITGMVGIGTATPQATLDVNGSINLPNATSSTVGVLSLGGVPFLSNYPGTAVAGNTFVGTQAGNFTMTGVNNSGMGSGALNFNTSGSWNTAFGAGALLFNTGDALSGGTDNTALGAEALQQNRLGSYNTAVGEAAGSANVGSYNTFIGYETGAQALLSNTTAVGANAYVGESNAVVLGNVLGQGSCVNTPSPCAGNVSVGIGTSTPGATLDVEAPSGLPSVNFFVNSSQGTFTVNGTTSITGSLTVNGQQITGSGGGGGGTVTSVGSGLGLSGGPITGSGTLSINTLVVPQLGGANTFTGTNNFTGNTTAASISATNLTTTGSISGGNIYGAALYLNGNSSNPFAYTSGSGGGDNAYLGFSGEFTSKFSPGDFNTAVGFGALNNNGGCCGAYVSSNNTATGSSALLANTTGASNTASGFEALYHNTTGSNNTAVGSNAGSPSVYEDTTGSNNTFLGASSSPGTQPALSYATAIGANAVVGQSNALVLGSILNMNGCTSPCMSTSVGIGTATPGATLDVEAPSATPPPTVNFGSASIPASFTINGTTNITGSLTVNGQQVTGGGGGGGTITGVTAGTGLLGGGKSGNVTLSLDPAWMNTFTGTQTFNVPTGNGIVASTAGTSNAGISGSNNSALGPGAGVAGFSVSGSGSGVVGTNSSASLGGGYGVQGLSYNTADAGVGGINNAPNGSAYGVWGQSLSSTGTGVYGTGSATGVTGSATGSGTGVYGTGGNIGVTGSAPGTGVFGLATTTAGTASGVLGQSNSPGGTGVTGLNSSAGGNGVSGQGFTGVNGAGAGSGVTGTSTSSTGSGVVGIMNSGGGYAGFFQGDVAITGNAAVSGNTTMTGNTAVGGNLAIGGDTPMSHSPRMTFSGTVASFATSPQAAGYFIPDQPIVITRLTVAVGYGQTPYVCNINSESMSLTINGNSAAKVFAPVGGVFYDSGALNIPVNAGTPIYMYGNSASGDPGCQSGNNINATVEYVMQ